MNPPSNKAVIASALVNANLPHQLGLASLLFWCDGDLVSS
jgi:hypothetical protein